MFLRQSTTQTVRFGPFIDDTDGKTAETALTIAQADMQLSKDGGAFAQKNAAGNATHDADGWYSTSLNATDTATVGELILQVHVAGALPVFMRFYVVEEAVYDAFYAASAAGIPSIPSSWITAAGIATAALDGKGDWNTTTPPTAASIRSEIDANSTQLAAILTDTGTTLENHLTDIKGGTFSGATDSLEAIRDRGDVAWTTGAGGTPPQLLQSTTIATLASQTSFTLTAGSADDDAYNGAIAVVTDQTTSTQKAVGTVSDYVGSTKTITLSSDPAIFTMAVGDTIEIIAALGSSSGGLTQQQVRDAMKLAPTAGSPAAGSVDDHLDNIEADTNELQTDDVPGLIAALNDVAATDIVSNGAITTLAGAVVNVDTVDTCTTNTDMRGTDGANTSTPPTAAAIRAEIDTNSTQLAAIVADTNELQTDNVPGLIAALNDISVADILTTQMTESYAADGVAPTLAQALFLIQQALGDFSIAGTTITVKKLDGSTTAATYTLDDGSDPTSRTRST